MPILLLPAKPKQPGTMVFLCVVENSHGEEKHQQQDDMRCDTYPEVSDTSDISGEGTAPHEGKDRHNKQAAWWIRDMPKRVLTGIKHILIGVINPESDFFHVNILMISVMTYRNYER